VLTTQPEIYCGCVNTIDLRSWYERASSSPTRSASKYLRINSTEIHVARISITYWQRLLPDNCRVVSNFIVQALRDQPLTLMWRRQPNPPHSEQVLEPTIAWFQELLQLTHPCP
jgi:hypothetical protein